MCLEDRGDIPPLNELMYSSLQQMLLWYICWQNLYCLAMLSLSTFHSFNHSNFSFIYFYIFPCVFQTPVVSFPWHLGLSLSLKALSTPFCYADASQLVLLNMWLSWTLSPKAHLFLLFSIPFLPGATDSHLAWLAVFFSNSNENDTWAPLCFKILLLIILKTQRETW